MQTAEIFDSLDYGPAPESAKPAHAWLDAHSRTFGMFIDGAWTQPDDARFFDTVEPATGKPLARITQASTADVDAAVAAARAAQPAWAALRPHDRARFLYALARQVQKHARLFAVLETLDNGKPIRETRDIDIPLVARHFYHHAGWAQLFETEMPGYQPVGVVGQIIPWNFPLLMLAWKVAPAMAMGNTVVLKPAEWTSLTALLFAEICTEIGLPPGVLNIVTGDGRVGEQIVTHAGVDKIAFTGSTIVGKRIRELTAGSGKKLSLELGGKSPFIVFDNADLDSVVEGVVDAIWFNQGQVCCAGSRLLVQENVAETLYEKLRMRMEKLRVGDPLDKAIDIGAIISPRQLQKIRDLVATGVAEGAQIWQPSTPCPSEGNFFPPTLFTHVTPTATIAQEEIFGPVLAAMTFRTPAEALALANNTRYGLAASVWSEDINLALEVAGKIKAGVVWINCTNQFDAASGFGGYRESGFGREGGREGLYEYVRRIQTADVRPPMSDNDGLPSTVSRPTSPIDRTPKLYIGGKQARPDSGYSRAVHGPNGAVIAEVGAGSRKDIRNAVEAARAAAGWGEASAHNRAQVLYYIAENLAARRTEFATRITAQTGAAAAEAEHEVDQSIEHLFAFAAWADKYDGAVHRTPMRNATLAFNEPIGVIGIACPEHTPLLGCVTLAAAALAMGNTAVLIPSEKHPLSATDLYQVLDTSDVPGGVLNIITGGRDELAKTLAEHADVDAIWYFGTPEGAAMIERASAHNLKHTWIGPTTTSFTPFDAALQHELLRQSTQVKNVWAPYGA
ncbi:MAG: aldehyde dehydrogenase family protein [Chloroflexi bacterium]|nr:aldehyde dehydrogenase family protein [Chloroflexota bacterium]